MMVPNNWGKMTAKERANWVLDNATISAKIEINESLSLVCIAYADDVQLGAAGEFETNEDAIEGGKRFLESIAGRV